MKTLIKEFLELVKDGSRLPTGWRLKAVVNDDNITYFGIHDPSKEALVVDPMKDDWKELLEVTASLEGFRFLGVIDTHTHADHISCAAELAEKLHTSLIMHQLSPSAKIQIRISRDAILPSAAGSFRILATPGHTRDSLTPIWGPFIFGGDTLMYGDTGRDDLPGGNPEEHYDSLQKIKASVKPNFFMLPGHDSEGGRISSWKTQLEVSPSLTQDRATFVKEAGAYLGPSPKNLKESLFYNFQ